MDSSSTIDRIGFRETRSFEFGNWRVQKQETTTFELASAPSHGDVRVPWAQPGAAARQCEAPTSSSQVGDNSFATRRPVSSVEFRDVQYGLIHKWRGKGEVLPHNDKKASHVGAGALSLLGVR